jgi:hypothetical protein
MNAGRFHHAGQYTQAGLEAKRIEVLRESCYQDVEVKRFVNTSLEPKLIKNAAR